MKCVAYRLKGAVILGALMLAGGCTEDVGGPAIAEHPTFTTVEDDQLAQIQAMYGGEADFVQMAAEEPSFAGYHIEDGGLIGLTADQGRRDAVLAILERHLSAPSDGFPLPPVREVRVVERPFLDLARYRNLLHTRMGEIPDFEWLDLDEVHNRVSLKVSSSEGQVTAWRIAEELNIPLGALDVFIGPPIQITADLTSRIRPVVGGLETVSEATEYANGTWEHTCTYGFNAVFAGELVFFTNSHCTREMYKDDISPSPFYQDAPFGLSSGEVGSEHEDPNGWDCSGVSDDPCRYSDAAAILLSVDEDSIGLGKLARTLSRATDDNKGSTTIDSSNPTFEVFGKQSYPSSGQEVNVLGRTGGWR